MAGIIPIPTTRTSSVLVQQRMLASLQFHQTDLLRIQNQLTTGLRISAPSDDAPSSLRAIGLQRLLERKAQVATNLNTSRSYLNATESSLGTMSNLLAEIRGTAVSVSGTTAGSTVRQAASQTVLRALQQLVDVGNQQFRGRYLFAGSTTTTAPYQLQNNLVSFTGNEGLLKSFADIDLLFDTNLTGNDVFGALSEEIPGSVDLNPILTESTKLRDLRGGQGIDQASFTISDGLSTRTIDISKAETVGDVVRLIEGNPPAGRKVTVRLTSHGLNINLDAAGAGNLQIKEIGGGTTAAQLGILNQSGVGIGTIVGQDLDPRMTLTTRLQDISGVRASALVASSGSNNDLIIEANQRGTELNGVRVQLVDDALLQAAPGLADGNERVEYHETATAPRASIALPGSDNDLVLTANTSGTALNNVQILVQGSAGLGNAAQVTYGLVAGVPTLTVQVDSAGATQLDTLVNAINTEGTFTAAADPSAGEGYVGTGTIPVLGGATVTGNTGNSGADAGTLQVYISNGFSNANQIVEAINQDPIVGQMFSARIDPKDTSSISQTGLGAVSISATGTTAGGAGVDFDQTSGLQIVNGGKTYNIRFDEAETIEEMLNILNGSGANVLAEINAAGTGISIRSRISGSDFSIGENGGNTASQLGVRTFTASTQLADLNHGRGVHQADGTDFTITRNDGVALEIDLSSAQSIGDVLNLINNHPDNLDPNSRVVARLKATGNGIEIVDDNPVGTGSLSISKANQSNAAWDLGLIPSGQATIRTSNAPPPAAANATIAFDAPNDANTSFKLTAVAAGDRLNGVQVVIQNVAASGNQALVNFDPLTKTLTIDVDPAATSANTVIAAITAEGTFSAELERSVDPTNNGLGLIAETGSAGVTSGGTPNPASIPASTRLDFAAANTDILVTARQAGTAWNGVEIVLQSGAVGNQATALYNSGTRQLIVQIDPAATTAQTIANAIHAEGHFTATLDTSTNPTNNGTGIVGTVGTIGTTAGGTAEVLSGTDTNQHETRSVFNSLLRLNDAILSGDQAAIQRSVELLDEDLDRLGFSRAGLGARVQGLDNLSMRLEDEDIELQDALSKEIEVDFTKAISDMSSRQAAYQAALQTMSQTMRMTLLDYL